VVIPLTTKSGGMWNFGIGGSLHLASREVLMSYVQKPVVFGTVTVANTHLLCRHEMLIDETTW
jgi:hypothetical protein